MNQHTPSNEKIADLLERIADLSEAQDANPFKVRAYRSAATSVRSEKEPVATYVGNGSDERLTQVPGIGEGIAAVISDYVTDGRSSLLRELESEVTPEIAFARVPGIGLDLAHRIVDTLHIHTLEELEQASHDGRLASVEGFGERRNEAVRTSLGTILRRRGSRRNGASGDEPSITLLLDIDAEYREKASEGKLEKIAPRRFNPDNEAWLPIMHAKRDGWNFTALYSNTGRAHDLNATDDWVVIYYDQGGNERQVKVVTETTGGLRGQRVVRGHEAETQHYYESRH